MLFVFEGFGIFRFFFASLIFLSREPFKAVVSENAELEKEIEDVFNQKRIEIGRGIFVQHPELSALALRHSQDMAANNRVFRV